MILFFNYICTKDSILKWVKTNLTFSWHSGFEGHRFLHFLSHFGKKKIKKIVPRPGFEPAIIRLEGQRANHYTMVLTTTSCLLIDKYPIFYLFKMYAT